jgi:pilus assembly protein CpaF
MQELFVYTQLGITPDGVAIGYHTATGAKSAYLQHFHSNGVELPGSMFEPATQPPMNRPVH